MHQLATIIAHVGDPVPYSVGVLFTALGCGGLGYWLGRISVERPRHLTGRLCRVSDSTGEHDGKLVGVSHDGTILMDLKTAADERKAHDD